MDTPDGKWYAMLFQDSGAVGRLPKMCIRDRMKADSGINLTSLKVDGGASANNLLMQMQADISNAPVSYTHL